MKRRNWTPVMKPVVKKGNPLSLRDTKALLADLPPGRAVCVDGVEILDTNDVPLDLFAQPRGKSCGVCGSTDVTAHLQLIVPESLGKGPDKTSVLSLVVGICGICESFGPEVFGEAVMRRLNEEVRR
jgi:hypothetical protein